MITGKNAVELAAMLAVGAVTAEAIEEELGGDMLATVLGLTGGAVGGSLAVAALRELDRSTGIVSDVGGLVDDVLSIF